ncbi:hypothetical protein DL770_004961 [Monosporascus sp. CRB-9-2]|nr:hypothetical protein DL770_004961 [Monosporascus sp. CRB-9-2]
MWDQYDIGFGNNRDELTDSSSSAVSLPGSQSTSQSINQLDPGAVALPIPDVAVNFPAKVPVEVKVTANKQTCRYPQGERSSAAKWAAAYVVGAAKKHFDKVADIYERVEETRRAKNEKERPEFGHTGAPRGVPPQDILQQAATSAGGLVPTEILNATLENIPEVEAHILELNDRLETLESQQAENLRTAESIEQDIEDAQERLAELERQERKAWPGFHARCWKGIHEQPWDCVEGVCYVRCGVCDTAMRKPCVKGKAPVCSTCKVKAAKTRNSTTAGLKKLAVKAGARENGSTILMGKIAPSRKRGANQLEDDADAAGPHTESSAGSWHNSGNDYDEQSPRQKRRRLSDADAEEADSSESNYRGRAATRAEESRKKRWQAEEEESSPKLARRSLRIARQRGAQSTRYGAENS